MKIAIAHDFLNVFGGAERVTLDLSKIFPDAPIYTLFYNKKNMGDLFADKKIITTSLQKKAEFLGFRHKYLLPFIPRAVEELNFSDYDVVISSQSAWMKGIITKPETVHISYCHTPTRFLWLHPQKYIGEQNAGFIKRYIAGKLVEKTRIWDELAADRVDYWLANSHLTKQRIAKFYRKEAEVIYPPVDTEKFALGNKRGDYFIIVSRLSGYKNIKIAVEAFNDLGLPLIVIGEGQEKESLQGIAKSNIKFLGFTKDKEMIKYLQEARAFIFPTFDEDFGLTPVEAMSCGTPVVAAKSGGVKETVVDEKTGILFTKSSAESLTEAIKKFLKMEKDFDKQEIRKHAKKFSKENFNKNIRSFVEESYKKGI